MDIQFLEIYSNNMDANNILWKVFLSTLIVLCAVFFILKIKQENCGYYETCDAMTAKIEKNTFVLFCLSESDSKLINMQIYEAEYCKALLKTNNSETLDLFITLKTFFNHEKLFKYHNLSELDKHCPYYVDASLIAFCFDDSITLSHAILNKLLYMNPHQLYQLYIFLKVFYL